jgi:VanZ family protein
MRRARPSYRWGVLAAYVAGVYAAIPFTADLGNAFVATPVGRWVFGPGLLLVVLGGGAGILAWLRGRHAPLWAYLLIGFAGAAYFEVLGSLAVRPLERVHLPEYGVAACLAWFAVRSHRVSAGVAFAATFALTALIGWGEEVIQYFVPGRFYDWRDVTLNALSAWLALLVLVALRSGEGRAGQAGRRVSSSAVTPNA